MQPSPEHVRALADRLSARLDREVRISSATLPLVIAALREYAARLDVAASLGSAEYQVREWGSGGSLIREHAVCRSLDAAIGAFEAVVAGRPDAEITMGQAARIIRRHGPEGSGGA